MIVFITLLLIIIGAAIKLLIETNNMQENKYHSVEWDDNRQHTENI